jgi:spermidine synthase
LNEFHVFDVIREPHQSLAAYEASLSTTKSNSYESQHADLFRPDRLVYSQGVLKLRRLGETAAYESLVHPAMVSHPSPQRVAIIGAGEGAALREVLKYQRVQQVLWIGADPTIVHVAKAYLKDWNDCSNLIGSAPSCFDDPRVKVLTPEESSNWFLNTLEAVLGDNDNNDRFDVVIVDDVFQGFPKTFPHLSTTIEANIEFLTSLYDAVLSDDGIVVIHASNDGFVGDTPIHLSSYANGRRLRSDDKMLAISRLLVKAGFPERREYQETHGGFGAPRNYVVAFKQSSSSTSSANNSDRENDSLSNWNDNVAMIELQLKKRAMQTRDGTSPFLYFDGATMSMYRASHAPSTADSTKLNQDKATPSCPLPLGFDTLSLLAPTRTVRLWRQNENMIYDDGLESSPPLTTTTSATPTSTTTTWTQNTSRLLSNSENGGLAFREGSMLTLKVQPFNPSTTVDPNAGVCHAAASSDVASVVIAKSC